MTLEPLHPMSADRARSRPRAMAFLALTKPRIVVELLITTVPTMVLAAQGWPGWWLVLATVVGGAAAAGSANAFNMVLDRDIDRLMRRTRQRPLVTGELSAREATVFAVLLGVGSLLWLGLLVNLASALFTATAVLLYVFLYTLWLKRRTTQNVVWGGAAGCMPVIIGWSAVTGTVGWPAVVLFLVVFFWTPAHYWPLALRYRDDYAAAGVPMLPVVRDATVVARSGLVYTVATVAASLALVPVAGMGGVYLVTASAAGAWFLMDALRLRSAVRHGAAARVQAAAMRVFRTSIVHVSLVFVVAGIDPFVS